MIESQLDSQTDGLSFSGKYQEYSVAVIADQFRYLAAEGRSRSVSTVLRIAAEQTRGRYATAGNPIAMLLVLVALTVVYGGSSIYAGRSSSPRSITAATILAFLDAILAAHCWTSRPRRRRYAAQADEIRRLALETLGVIVGRVGFATRALTKEQRRAFASLRTTDPEGWIQVAKSLAREPA